MVLSLAGVASTHDDCIGSCGDERIKRFAITTIDALVSHPAKYNCNTLVMLVFQKSGTRGDRLKRLKCCCETYKILALILKSF